MNSKYLETVSLVFRTLRYRNYRLFFAGQCISLIGTWMQQIAVSWLVYRLTHSVFLLGVVGFAGQFPIFLLSFFTGVLSDRWNRLRTVILTQTFSMLQAMILAVLVLTDTVAIWHIITLTVLLGCINALDMPARQSFVVDMIEDPKDLGNAIALNSMIFNGARFIGPSVAGILIALVGEGICILINAVSYIAVIAALLAMNISQAPVIRKNTNLLYELKEGFDYAYGSQPIRLILWLLALTSVMGVPYAVLMPAFTTDILHGEAHTLGFLMSAAGAGALIGAFYLASRKSVINLYKIIPLSAGVFGLGLIVFSVSRMIGVSLVLMLIVGFGIMVQVAASNTLLQTIVDDDKRGRIMSFFAFAFIGMTPLGSFMAGTLAGLIGITETILIGGICCVAGALFFSRKLPALKSAIHGIYTEKGIITPP